MEAKTKLEIPDSLKEIRNLRVEEAAAVIGIGRTMAYELVMSGKLGSVKIGKARRIPASAVQKYLAAQDGSGTAA